MTVEEANKINDLYKEIDTLAAENELLKTTSSNSNNLLDKLEVIDAKLDELLKNRSKVK